MREICLGFGLHRPETLPAISEAMRRHDAVFLEEPPTPGFDSMLRGKLAVDDYLLSVDAEYPAFSRAMCRLMRELHAEGKPIHQVEPFIETLLQVHEFFADGRGPSDLPRDSLEFFVHRSEQAASGALLAYYQAVESGSFEKAVAAVVRFAQADAARFRLRDSLRAQALTPLLLTYPSSFVECGLMHFQLLGLLRRRLPPPSRVRPLFLAEAALTALGARGRLYGPGDRLTLLYVFQRDTRQTRRAALLAAQSMVYSKILLKQETENATGTFPHLRDELACIRAADQLSFEDCRRLFPLIRRASTSEARLAVARLQAESDSRRVPPDGEPGAPRGG
jgi:hypothetical protein